MNPWLAPLATGGLAAVAAVIFGLGFRLPLPFPGFAAIAAAALAGLGTLAIVAWLPRSWLWTEDERLRFAFQARHGLSGEAAQGALVAITVAHQRAARLRRAGQAMRDDMAQEIRALADRLDAAAREIFYVPDRRRSLSRVLSRSELIEDAALAHAALRGRNQAATENTSREKLRSAVAALDAAFDETELLAARGLLQEVSVASDVAESLLTPRHAMTERHSDSTQL